MFSVSVIIPTYNSPKLIGETISAALAQTLSPHEIIVVDDGSTDDTEAAVRAFPEVRYYKITNSGTGSARNVGVSMAGGDWIAFCDHDDLWRPNYLENFANNLSLNSKYGFSNWVDVIGDIWTNTDKFSSLPSDFFSTPSQPLYPNLIDYNPVWPSAVLIRRDFFNQIGGFNQKFSRYATEDFEFTFRCNEHSNAVILHDPLVGIRKHKGNYSKGRIRQNLSDAAILNWSAENHHLGRQYRQQMMKSADARRAVALDEAFLQGNLAQVRDIATLIAPENQKRKTKLKIAVAKSRIVPGVFVKAVIGRRHEEHQTGIYANSDATPE